MRQAWAFQTAWMAEKDSPQGQDWRMQRLHQDSHRSNIKTKEVTALKVTREDVGDNKKFKDLHRKRWKHRKSSRQSQCRRRLYTYENFEELDTLGIQAIIPVAKNSVTDPPPDRFIARRRGELAQTKHARKQLQDQAQ